MMTSSNQYTQGYVWIWLPGETVPVVAGRLATEGKQLIFNYGKSYLARDDAIAIYAPELPLRTGALPLLPGLNMPNCIRDASPDAWGRQFLNPYAFYDLEGDVLYLKDMADQAG